MAEHTPGPWIAIHDYDKHYVEPVEETPRGDYIAYCSGQGDIALEEAEANANFIVCACNAHDDLLAVCETAMEWAAGYPLSGAFGVTDKWAADEVYEQCKAAIAKAKSK